MVDSSLTFVAAKDENIFYQILFGAFTGIVFVLALLKCLCCVLKRSGATFDQSDGYQNIEARHGKRPTFAFSKKSKNKDNASGSSDRQSRHKRELPPAPPPNFPIGAPLPRGTITRESSTSELYACVDRNPNGAVETREFGDENSDDTYSKVGAAFHAIPTSHQYPIGRARSPIMAIDVGDPDPFYSQVKDERRTFNRKPMRPTKSAHPYDYPQFRDEAPRRSLCSPKSTAAEATVAEPAVVMVVDADDERNQAATGDALPVSSNTEGIYSRIVGESQDADEVYYSIKSDEPYSRVWTTDETPTTGHRCVSTAAATMSAADGRMRPRRSRSDGEEYSVIKKSKNAAPPVPEKRFDAIDHYNQRHSEQAAGPSGVRQQVVRRTDSERMLQQQPQPKTEPSYRYITVRESLDALRARMEAAAVETPPLPVAHSDSSLHYYSTISEHSYEVVPARRDSDLSASNAEEPVYTAAVGYIDDSDDYAGCSVVTGADRGPLESTKCDDNDAELSIETVLNVSTHSQGSRTTAGSHVTLVQVGGGEASNEDIAEVRRPSSCNVQQQLLSVTEKSPKSPGKTVSESALHHQRYGEVVMTSGTDLKPTVVTGKYSNDSQPFSDGCMSSFEQVVSDDQSSSDYASRLHDAPNLTAQERPLKNPEILLLDTLENFNVSTSSLTNGISDPSTGINHYSYHL